MDDESTSKYKKKYWHRFGESLSFMRTKESSDVVLECGKSVFYAHKVILIASSPYFRRMFQSGLQESKSGRIIFKAMDASSLDAILDFVYRQDVKKMTTEEQLKNVMVASHLLELDELFQYCADELTSSSSSAAVFMYLFTLCENYEARKLQNEVRKLWSTHNQKLVSDRYFLNLPLAQIQDLINFLDRSLLCLDYMFLGVLKWVKHDMDQRKRFARSLLDSINIQLVTKDCIRSLFEYPELVALSQDVANKIKEIGWCILLMDDNVVMKHPSTTGELFGATTRLVFFCRNQNTEVFYPDKNCAKATLKEHSLCVQQLNLDRMEWLTCRNVDFNCDCAAICQHGRILHMACGSHLNYGLYDPEKNSIEQFEYTELDGRSDVGMCSFKEHIYVIGGYTKSGWITAVHYAEPCSGEWHEAAPLNCLSSEPYVLTTSYYIFVLSYNYRTCDISVEYNSDPTNGARWEIMYVHKTGTLTCSSFLIANNTLQALYVDSDGDMMHLMYDHRKKQMEAKKHRSPPSGCTAVSRICPGLDNHLLMVCLSKESEVPCDADSEAKTDRGDAARNEGKDKDAFYVPNFLWNPDNGSWLTIGPPAGRCDGKYALSSLLCIL